MVVGNGLMAKAFKEYQGSEKDLVFASGVSNSSLSNDVAFDREFAMVKEYCQQYPNLRFIYFSTCSIYDQAVKDRDYVKHKLRIEEYVKNNASNYLIFRISNVVGKGGHENTILNFLVNAISNDRKFELWKGSERNLIDSEDVVTIINSILATDIKNTTINVAMLESLKVLKIVELIENHLGKKAQVRIIDKGNPLKIDVTQIHDVLKAIEISKGRGTQYLNHLLIKYY